MAAAARGGASPRRGRRASLASLLVVATGLAVGVVLPAAPAAAYHEACRTTPMVAHRGIWAPGTVEENTLAALRGSVTRGAGFEIDLRTTADDKVVLMHDRTVARTTTGTGRVARMTEERIRRLRTDGGLRVPFVQAALRLAARYPGATVVLDLKTFTRRSHRALATAIADHGVGEQVVAISFSTSLLDAFRRHNPGVRAMLTTRATPAALDLAGYDGAVVNPGWVEADWVERMREAGLVFASRPTQDPLMWDHVLGHGASWLLTTDLAAWAAYCDR